LQNVAKRSGKKKEHRSRKGGEKHSKGINRGPKPPDAVRPPARGPEKKGTGGGVPTSHLRRTRREPPSGSERDQSRGEEEKQQKEKACSKDGNDYRCERAWGGRGKKILVNTGGTCDGSTERGVLMLKNGWLLSGWAFFGDRLKELIWGRGRRDKDTTPG